MCWMIYAPIGRAIPEDWIRTAWNKNHDGAGYMFAVDGTLHVRKAYWKLSDLLAAYQADLLAYGDQSAFILHLRWSTHGKEDDRNTHPHVLDNGRAALCHNGVLSNFEPPWKSDISDTVFFCSTVLAARSAEQLLDETFGKLLGEMIGKENKFALMDCAGNVAIVNQEMGTWDGDFWVSNLSHDTTVFKPKPIVQTTAIVQTTPVARGIVFDGKDKLPAKYQPDLWEREVDEAWERFHATDNPYEDAYDEAMVELAYYTETGPLERLTAKDLYAMSDAAWRAADAIDDDTDYQDALDDENDDAAAWLRERERQLGEVP